MYHSDFDIGTYTDLASLNLLYLKAENNPNQRLDTIQKQSTVASQATPHNPPKTPSTTSANILNP